MQGLKPPGRTTAIFSKRPAPGEVKTRLCPPLAPEAAAALAEAMLADLVERLSADARFATALCFAPPEAEAWFRAAFPMVADQRPQRGGLAERLARFFEEELAESGGSAVVVGSDAPLLDPARVAEAHERLEAGADLVLGPDAGGGYYLVGLRAPHAELFGVPMSTDTMCAETVALARAGGLAVELLEPGRDVDLPADLEHLRRELEHLPPTDPRYPLRTAEWVRRHAPAPTETPSDHE